MDIASQWPQDNGVVIRATAVEKSVKWGKVRTEKERALNCPRCNSSNTKFCYYNNYSLSQPRHFCKTCRRYWTQGGSLRNIPVGGASRKAGKSSSYSQSSSKKAVPADPIPPKFSSQNPKIYQGEDLNSRFDPSIPPIFNWNGGSGTAVDLPFDLGLKHCNPKNPNFSSSFPDLDHFKASQGFVEDGHQSTASIFPLEVELKTVSSSDDQIMVNGHWSQCWMGI